VDAYLLTNLVQEGVLKDHQKKAIMASSNLNYNRAQELYDVLGTQVEDLEKICKVFDKTGNKQAINILKKFLDQHPTVSQQVVPSNVSSSNQGVQQHAIPSASSSQAQHVRADAINSSVSAANIPVAPSAISARQSGAEIIIGGKLKLASSTSRDSLSSSISKSLADIRDAIKPMQHYPTLAKYKGIALIVNVITFDNEPELSRSGAQKDTDELTKILHKRNFLVYHLIDPNYAELQGVIEQLRTHNYESADSFLIAVMSHGDGERIITKDRKRFEIWRGIVQQFNNVNCEGLKGKPKIFVFNYCRGDTTDVGTGSTQHDAMPERITPWTIPSWTDMLVCYSTLDGHYAYRDVNEGSWFIQTLCEVLNQHGENYDINTLLNLVSEVMKSLESENGEKQICPYYNIGFTKKFYL
jgi:caspase-like apoptosis-related cysteine protease